MSAPYQPQNVVLQTGNGQNFLLWDIVVGATSYSVQRSTDGINFSSPATATTNNYLDTTVLVGINYFYQVASVNSGGTSSYSASYPASIVPCLPGQINLGYLRYASQLRTDKLNSLYLTTDEWNFNINQSADELYDILITKFGDNYFFAPQLIIPLTGQSSYPIPDGSNYPINGVNSPACHKLCGLDYNFNGATAGANAGWVPMSRFNWSDRDKFTIFPGFPGNGSFNNTFQMSYREMGQTIQVIPPNTNALIRLNYVPIRYLMLQDTDMMAFSFSGWSEYVINDAAKKGMIKEESLEKWNALDAANEKIRLRIETTASNRDVDQPNTVSNVRNTMGDPGFGGWGDGFGGGFGGFGGF